MSAPLKLALVGHTNVGKTSLLRTLTRDVSFGEVSHRPSTTRHVEGARLSVDGEPLLELYDTPGLEDAIALLDHLERIERPGERLDGPARTARFLDGSEARQRFEQEAKVLRQLLASDAGLYVIDAREPVLAKYKDELAVLAGCGKPLLPVLNFVARLAIERNSGVKPWRGWACMRWCVSTAWLRRSMASAGSMKAWRCCWNSRGPSCSA
jgi:predicted GTPase